MEGSAAEFEMLKLRSTATELLLKENWCEYINLYSRFISSCDFPQTSQKEDDGSLKLRRTLCSALCNRADAYFKIRDLDAALMDCNHALKLDPFHFKALVCKGKILLDLHCYSQASECFQRAKALPLADSSLSLLLKRSQKLDSQSKTGFIDLSAWVLDGFNGACPELAEFVRNVEIRRSESGGGRGLFATRSVEAGTPLVITKAVVLGRGIMPKSAGGETARLVMWKDFVDKIINAVQKCSKTRALLYTLSTGDGEDSDFTVPKIELFKPEFSMDAKSFELDVERILKVLDVNCLTEESVSAKVMGKKKECCGVGLWFLPSFVNHSCCPNARRLHVGDTMVLYASRDVKEGEELSFAYFNVLLPLNERREMAKRWGFFCSCERCNFEEKKELELGELNETMEEVEDRVRRWGLKGKGKGYLRASFWPAYRNESEKLKRRRVGSRITEEISVAGSIFDAVGGDERIMRSLLKRMKNDRGFGHGVEMEEMEKLMRMARGVYGKVMKRRAMKAFFELELASTGW
ncbi:uncharacterized protein LOC110022208 [Phalaenopsis equestris]|uniref:uncharacterized protein LOC110022208 n=1 Tax=Phalaenopsis equestris TaxID=78828 RepID=UPI0009E33B8A|nr:uncharacterized protein LOC110022208 [Phalaenopsis equestris]